MPNEGEERTFQGMPCSGCNIEEKWVLRKCLDDAEKIIISF